MTKNCFLSLGSNLGDRRNNIVSAINFLLKYDKINFINISDLYKSEPMYYDQQSDFYNIVLEINTSLLPIDLMKLIIDYSTVWIRKF